MLETSGIICKGMEASLRTRGSNQYKVVIRKYLTSFIMIIIWKMHLIFVEMPYH